MFGAGFVLGTVRVLWLALNLGTRAAELMEMPVMLVAVILAARWTARRLAVSPAPIARLGVGLVALGLLLVAEFAVVLRLRDLTIDQYLASRDSVAGTLYIAMLGVFAVMPLLVARR